MKPCLDWRELLWMLAVVMVCGCGGDLEHPVVVAGQDNAAESFAEVPPLWIAARSGDLAGLKRLVEAGADLSAVLLIPYHPDHGTTPLHLAADCGHLEMVRWILDQGVDVNQRGADPYEAAALVRAAGGGQHAAARLLLERGAAVNQTTRTGHTALDATRLHTVGSRQRRDLTQAVLRGAGGRESGLLKLGGESDPDLWSALFTEDAGGLIQAIRSGGDVNVVDPIRKFSPLMEAVGRGDVELVRVLLDHGALVDRGWLLDQTTPLGYAAWLGEADVALLLLERGADRKKKDIQGRTPIARAAAPLTWEEQVQVNQFLMIHHRVFDLERVRAGRRTVAELLGS